MSCETSQLSCGSYLSEMSFDESCTLAVVQQCSRGTAQPTNPFDDSAACDSVVVSGNVLEDSALDETAPGVEGRCQPFKSTTGRWEVGGWSGCHDEPVVTGSVSAADTAYFLRELASSESDESSHKPLPAKPNRRWSWLRVRVVSSSGLIDFLSSTTLRFIGSIFLAFERIMHIRILIRGIGLQAKQHSHHPLQDAPRLTPASTAVRLIWATR
jgi:hypothetical protein